MTDPKAPLPRPEFDKMIGNLSMVIAGGRDAVMLLARIASDGKMPLEYATEAGQVVGKYIVAAMASDVQAAKAKNEGEANELTQKTIGKMTAPGPDSKQ